MSNLSPIDANRPTQKSTGPRTNAPFRIDAKDVVLPGEDPVEFEQLRQEVIDKHQAATFTEFFYVDYIATSIWKWRRFRQAELIYSSYVGGHDRDAVDRAQRSLQRQIKAAIRSLSLLKRDWAATKPKAAAEPKAPVTVLPPKSTEPTQISPGGPRKRRLNTTVRRLLY